VTLFTLIVFVLSIWSLAFFASRILREEMQRLTGEQQFSTVSLLAADLTQQLNERLAALQLVARQLSPVIKGNTKAIQLYLEQQLTLQGHFNGGVTVLRLDGTAIADVPLAAGRVGVNYMDTEVTATALRDGTATISRPMMGKSMKAPIIVMAVPILDAKGNVAGAISGVTNLGGPNFLDAVTNGRYGKTGGFLLNAPQYRLIVTASDKDRIMEALPAPGANPMIDRFIDGYEGSILGVSPKGVEVLASAKSVPVAGWYVAAQLPTKEAFAPIRETQQRMLLATILLTLLAGGLSWWMLKRQLSPLLVTVKTMASFTSQNLPLQPLHISRQDEIGELIGGFNRLLEKLQLRDVALRESEERYRTLVEWSLEAVAVHRNGTIIYVNPVALKLFGATSANEIVGRHVLDFVHINFHKLVIARMKATISTGIASPLIEEKYCKLDGTEMELEVQSRQIVFGGEPATYVAMRDITERKQAQREIETLAFFDSLTGLPNRRLLIDRLEQALAASSRHQRVGALLCIDLDNFKDLNDTLGHDKGDLLLQQVGRRLSSCMREGDTVARFGGDEFVVILQDLSQSTVDAVAQVEIVAEKIRLLLGQIYDLSGYPYHSTPSIGVALFGNDVKAVAEILRRADLAMYQAKMTGRNSLRFFDPSMQASVTARSAMERDLHRALAENHFSLHYQGQVKGERQLIGVEAMLRWRHPERGLVFPAEFIHLAEENGQIVPIGKWVLEAACIQLASWAAQSDFESLTIAVNVSAREFQQEDFVTQVMATLHRTGAKAQRLKLELTESVLVSNVEDILTKMSALKEHGVGFSLDDFGTGYSSLSYLKRLPLDQLKIDQSFVRDILIDPNDAAIAKMVVALAQNLGLTVIAEGVETQAQRTFLAAQGCDTYQGYLVCQPLPIDEFEAFARRR
jgi:diguanylate cyclase (GGDEF)-like protein/PAS domain S-box-containing protein